MGTFAVRPHERHLTELILQGFAAVKAAAGSRGVFGPAQYEALEKMPATSPAVAAMRDDIARYVLERGQDRGEWHEAPLSDPLGNGRGFEQVAADFARRVLRYDRWVHGRRDGLRTRSAEPKDVIWVKRARNHSGALAETLAARTLGPVRIVERDGLTVKRRKDLARTALEDFAGHGRQVLLSRCEAAALPAVAAELVRKENLAMKSDPEGFLGAVLDELFVIYRSREDHTVAAYVAQARGVCEGGSYERTITFDLKGRVLADVDSAG